MSFIEMEFGSGKQIKDVAYGTTPTINTTNTYIDCGFEADEVWVWAYVSSSKAACSRWVLGTSSSTYYGVYKASSSTSGIDNGIAGTNVLKNKNGFVATVGSTSSIYYGVQWRYVAIKYAD